MAKLQNQTDESVGGDDFIDEPTLCERLQISRGTAINHRNSGLLPFVKIGRQVRYHWGTVKESLIRQQRQAA
jgi:hypothetical protein